MAYLKHAKNDNHVRLVEERNAIRQSNANVIYTGQLPVVFLSVFEHNSNLLPWREAGARIEVIPMDQRGDFDYKFLEKILFKYKTEKCIKIGAFSAGSNITGTIFDVDRIAVACHSHDCLAIFDYAAVSPY